MDFLFCKLSNCWIYWIFNIPKKMKDKPISEMNIDELNIAIDEKKALPDLIQKRIIFMRKKEMIDARERLQESALKNNGYINYIHKIEFRQKIISCFLEVIDMVREAGITTLDNIQYGEKNDFEMLMDMIYEIDIKTRKPYSVRTLTHLCLYVTYCLHRLNLTNLFYDEQYIQPKSLEDLA